MFTEVLFVKLKKREREMTQMLTHRRTDACATLVQENSTEGGG